MNLKMDADFLEKTMSLFKLQEGLQKSCAVCHEVAHSCNFGVITCDPCKAFFRRNAHKENILEKCNRKCDVTGKLRSACQSCRLRKCFDKGMKKDLILNDQMKKERKKKIEANRLKRLNVAIGSPPSSRQNSPCSSSLGSPLPQSPDSHHHDRAKLRTSKSCSQLSDALDKPNYLSRQVTNQVYSEPSSKKTATNWFNFSFDQVKPEHYHRSENYGPNICESSGICKHETGNSRPDCSFQTNMSPLSPLVPFPRNASCPSSFCFDRSPCPALSKALVGQGVMTSPCQGCCNYTYPQEYHRRKAETCTSESDVFITEDHMCCISCEVPDSMNQSYGSSSTRFDYSPDRCGWPRGPRQAYSCPSFSMSDSNSGILDPKSNVDNVKVLATSAVPLNSRNLGGNNSSVGKEHGIVKNNRFLEKKEEVLNTDDDHYSTVKTASVSGLQCYTSVKGMLGNNSTWKHEVVEVKDEPNDEEVDAPCSNCDWMTSWVTDTILQDCTVTMEPYLQESLQNVMSSFSDFLQKVVRVPKKQLQTFEAVLSAYEECIREGVKLTKQLKSFQCLERCGQIELLQNNLLNLVHLLFLHLHDISSSHVTGNTEMDTKTIIPPLNNGGPHRQLLLQYLQCYESVKGSLTPIQDDAIIQGCIMALVLFSPNAPEQDLFLHSEFVVQWHKTYWRILEWYVSQHYYTREPNMLQVIEEFLRKNSSLGGVAKKMFSSCSTSKLSPLITEAFDIHPENS